MSTIVYFVQRENGDIKIGCTTGLISRLRTLCLHHGALTLLGTIEGDKDTEKALHTRFTAYRLSGTYHPIWKRNLATEWFRPATELLHFITDHARKPPQKQSYFVTDISKKRFRVISARNGIAARNRLQEMLKARYDDVEYMNVKRLSEEVGLSPVVVWTGLHGLNQYLHKATAETWARFLDCSLDELIEVVE